MIFAKKSASIYPSRKEDIQVIIFENGVKKTFEFYSGQELSSIQDYIMEMLDIYWEDIQYKGEEDDVMIIKNICDANGVGNKTKYPIDKKIRVYLRNYGVNAWEDVEFMFVKVE